MTATIPNTLAELERLSGVTAEEILARLPQMGRVMVIARAGGATHERIGPVEAMTRVDGRIQLSGPCHTARITQDFVAAMRIDRRSVMKGKVYPHLEFLDAAGVLLFAVVGMDGAEAMDAALRDLAHTEEQPEPKPDSGPRGEAAEIPADDPALVLLTTLIGSEVEIAADTGVLAQSWSGTIEGVKPAMGFVNVMTPDFHLHLKAGSVAAWASAPGSRMALDAHGKATGLEMRSEAFL